MKQHQRQDHANQGQWQRGHQGQRLQKAFELAGQDHVNKNDRHHQCGNGIGKGLFHVFRRTAKLVAIAIGQLQARHDGLDFFGDVSAGASKSIAAEGHFTREFTAVDLVGAHTLAHLSDLVESDGTGAAVRCRG